MKMLVCVSHSGKQELFIQLWFMVWKAASDMSPVLKTKPCFDSVQMLITGIICMYIEYIDLT